ncbi:MAG TPA: FAD-binding protein, partial [bacterium]|nr:FAD-binding protein [bacterium]
MDWTEHLEKAARGKVSRGEPMSRHTTFGVGGPADVFFEPLDEEDLRNALRLLSLEGVRRAIIGRGANLLFSDEGYGGCVIRIGKGLGSIDYDGRTVKLGAGVSL